MNPAPLVEAPLAIQVHAVSALAAFLLGAAILWRRKGSALHRILGRVWVTLMLVTALSAFFIHEIRVWGEFSPIHIIAITTPVMLTLAIRAARQGDIRRHRLTMQATYVGALIVAGVLSFLPGRIMYRVAVEPFVSRVFMPADDWMLAFVGALGVAVFFGLRALAGRAR